MSIIGKRFSAACIVFAAVLLFETTAAAQTIEATIVISSTAQASVRGVLIKENSNQTIKNWSFLNSIAGAENLGARISEFNLSDDQNRAVSVRKLADGEYLTDAEASKFNYLVNLQPPATAAATAHVSWLSGETGLLMLGDLLPQLAQNNQPIRARIKFQLPADCIIISNEKKSDENVFDVENIERAIFGIGKSWRQERIHIAGSNVNLAISGEWQFSGAEALAMTGAIYETYQKMFGEIPTETPQIFLARFPNETKFGRWMAETRGANITILSADMPFKTQSAQRLHEQLRHEVFHLWMPNRLALTGNYDWFYEGFTVYQSLRTGVSMNQIRFEDYLATLAEAYNLDHMQTVKFSLLESSENRWRAGNSQFYARGMLAGFLCDVALLRASGGKRSVSTIFREVYRKHRIPNKPEDGNAAILNVFKNYSELNQTIEKYIVGREKINWETDLETIGIELNEDKLVVKAKLNGKQKDLLNKLGYNNWRKVSGKRK
jgi:hypothetical protein